MIFTSGKFAYWSAPASLGLLGLVPMAWVGWNWIRTGHPLAFFSSHSEYSADLLGSRRLVSLATRRHQCDPGVPLVIQPATRRARGRQPATAVFTERCSIGSCSVIWSLLLGFLTGLDLPLRDRGKTRCLRTEIHAAALGPAQPDRGRGRRPPLAIDASASPARRSASPSSGSRSTSRSFTSRSRPHEIAESRHHGRGT